MEAQLIEWVKEKSLNGIKQHGDEWLAAKVSKIGGSSLATIQGKNPYSNICGMIAEKIGLSKFNSNIMPQWGNLFEDVIKRYFEHKYSCEVLGEDLYVYGPPGTSYSPDGLAVMDMNGTRTTVLVEFKCPFSRIPTSKPPAYYIPQVKMGLEILEIPTVGMLIEGVFRRCTWEQLGDNNQYDKTLTPKSAGGLPLAYGIIGFRFDEAAFNEALEVANNKDPMLFANLQSQKDKMFSNYIDNYVEMGDNTNNYMCNDLGEASVKLFTEIMDAYDKKILIPWYGDMVFPEGDHSLIGNDVKKYTAFCKETNSLNIGILPWKLFYMAYHNIEKEVGYLEPWLPKIREILDIVAKCNDPENASKKINIFNSYVSNNSGSGFSDM